MLELLNVDQPKSGCAFITMNVTFHERKSFFVSPLLREEKTLEVYELSFLSLPYLFLLDPQVLSDEAIANATESTYSEEEDKFFVSKYQRSKQPTSTPNQEGLIELDVRIPKDNNEEINVLRIYPLL